MDSSLFYFAVSLTACLLGTIPFGPINLTVVKTTVDHNAARGTEVAFAASLVEILQALIAIWFGMVISNFLETSFLVRMGIATIFIVLAVFIFARKPSSTFSGNSEAERSFFVKGLLIAALNPQAVPFWIFALAAISQYFDFAYEGIYLLAFLAGVFAGKLIALYGFVIASSYLKSHLEQSSVLVNRLLASVLLFIGLTQGWNALAV